MNKQRAANLALICLFAFAGGMTAEWLSHRSINAIAAESVDTENSVRSFRDVNGKVRMDLGVRNGQPVQNLWGEDGKPRLQLGTYDGSGGIDEKGLPVTAFYDNEGRIRMLLRVASGKNQSPVLVMKDTKSRDRIVMGLSLNGADEEPFLVYYTNDGKEHAVFGAFN